jgi:phospholipase C
MSKWLLLLTLTLLVPAAAQADPPGAADLLRQLCFWGPGALPADTAPQDLHGADIPIEHIVVLMQENRSFDHYFGQLHFQGQPRALHEPKNASNPDPTGGAPIGVFHQTALCEVADLDHSWTATHEAWDRQRMDGFTAINAVPADPTGSRAMGYYDETDLPYYYALYATFAMGDRYYSSVLGPTFPNRFYLLAGTSFGHIRNDFPTVATQFDQPSIFNRLDAAGVSWKIYFHDLPFGFLFAYVRNHTPGNVLPVSQYFTDAAAGNLPQVAFVDPRFLADPNIENDEHPPANPQVGQNFVAKVVAALMASPNWGSSALFLTYDEHGGYYDHVPVPQACIPDDIAPMLGPGDTQADFDRFGIRVPVVVISPFARPHFVSHQEHDHTSILRFIETRFDLPALTRRDANSDPMLEFFDFRRAAFATPPELPEAVVDPARAAECPGPPPLP